jgi:glutaredoxin
MLFRRTSSISTVGTTTVHFDNDGFLLYTKPSCRFCLAAKALIQHLRNDEQTIQKKNYTTSTQEQRGDRAKIGNDDDDSSSSSVTWEESSSSSSFSFAIMEEVEVGKEISPAELENALGRTVKTVPQILYKGNYIGGYEDLVNWLVTTFPHANLPDTVQLVEKFRQQ